MLTVPPVPPEDWTPKRIKALRKRLGMTQGTFGTELFDYSASVAQPKVSHLESGDYKPSAAVRRTLQRLEAKADQE
jgi:DNA-binding transcriptional regulator YiaG